MKSDRKVVAFPKASPRVTTEGTAFLPAALEIVETPASPAGRAVALVIIAIFCISLAWATLGKIDIVASAPGKGISSGGTKGIQPFETGILPTIPFRDGQHI